jgi:hypothetical protein
MALVDWLFSLMNGLGLIVCCYLQSILYYRMGAVKSKSDHSAHRHAERQIIQQPPEQQQPPYNMD